MAKETAIARRGRPQLYPLTKKQELSIRAKIAKGVTSREIEESMGVHSFAILRVRRAIRRGE